MDTTRRLRACFEQLESRCVLAANPMLPDLFPWADETRGFLHDYVVEGNLLRFSTAFANQGVGNLELRAGDVVGNSREVIQRVFNDDGSVTDLVAGTFTYHPSHGHIHFDNYAIYNLRVKEANGDIGPILATGGKISFCLIDISRYDSGAGPAHYDTCGDVQGISSGWADVYNRFLADQWINIATIDDGDYYLEVIADPEDLLLESDETNNVTTIEVLIDRDGSTMGDPFEPNDQFAVATDLGAVSYRLEPGVSIHTPGDVDFFRFSPNEDGPVTASISFTHDLGNLDMDVYDADQNLLLSAASQSDNETLTWAGLQAHEYYIHVRGVAGSTNGYTLEIDGPGDTQTLLTSSEDPALPASIPDGVAPSTPGMTLVSTLQGPDIQVDDLNLRLDYLEHRWLADLQIELESPAGTRVAIVNSAFQNPPGPLSNDDDFMGTVLDDQAPLDLTSAAPPFTGRFHIDHASVGDNPLSRFNGESAAGTWRLYLTDWYRGDAGTLHDWGLEFTGNLGDRFEPNEDFAQGVNLGTGVRVFEPNLSIHADDDVDYFRFRPDDDGIATLEVLFAQADGDLAVTIYDSTLAVVMERDSATDHEILRLPVEAGETYYVAVTGNGDTNAYDLRLRTIRARTDLAVDGIPTNFNPPLPHRRLNVAEANDPQDAVVRNHDQLFSRVMTRGAVSPEPEVVSDHVGDSLPPYLQALRSRPDTGDRDEDPSTRHELHADDYFAEEGLSHSATSWH